MAAATTQEALRKFSSLKKEKKKIYMIFTIQVLVIAIF